MSVVEQVLVSVLVVLVLVLKRVRVLVREHVLSGRRRETRRVAGTGSGRTDLRSAEVRRFCLGVRRSVEGGVRLQRRSLWETERRSKLGASSRLQRMYDAFLS